MSDQKGLISGSIDIMLREHDRLSELYICNKETGEKRITLYLTILSIGTAGLSVVPGDRDALLLYGWLFAWAMAVLGSLTYWRLVERHVNAICYLRAINRIHRFFVDHDCSLDLYFYWNPSDTEPSFERSGMGLGEMMLGMNSVVIGLAGGLSYLLFAQYSYLSILISVLVAGCALLLGICLRGRMIAKACRVYVRSTNLLSPCTDH